MAAAMNRIAVLHRAVFARHANPWSAWSRWATTPLIALPVWTRNRRHAAAVAVWFAVNPVLFPPPADTRAWSTRAMLGEERWITERPRDGALLVSMAASAATVLGLVAARRRRPVATAAALAVAMGLTMGYWQLMVRYRDRALRR